MRALNLIVDGRATEHLYFAVRYEKLHLHALLDKSTERPPAVRSQINYSRVLRAFQFCGALLPPKLRTATAVRLYEHRSGASTDAAGCFGRQKSNIDCSGQILKSSRTLTAKWPSWRQFASEVRAPPYFKRRWRPDNMPITPVFLAKSVSGAASARR
jgi:hypothetical protein